MPRRRARVVGTSKLRRKFQKMPKAMTQALRDDVRWALNQIEIDAIGGAPVDEGDLVRSIETKISSDGFAGIVGPGVKAAEIVRRKTGSPFGLTLKTKFTLSAKNKHALFQFFKGYWIEFGTKGSSKHNIPPMSPRPFMTNAYNANREKIRRRVRATMNRILERASRG